MVVGTVNQYKTESAANKAVASLRIHINNETTAAGLRPISIEQLVEHYTVKELTEKSMKAYSTSAVYKQYLKNWILPKWGPYRIRDVKTVAVEEWLEGLLLANGTSMANGTKAKLRNIMSALFRHAMRHEWVDKNPIALVRQSAKRERVPEILDVQEIQSLLSELHEPYQTMVLVAVSTGLRVSELLALKWSDINFESLEITLNRAVVHQVIGGLKTEASRKPIPLAPEVGECLLNLRSKSAYRDVDDWVFASPEMAGTQPYWPENVLRRHIRPAAKRAGITKNIGWHTFRHSYATLLKGNGEDVKIVQECLRHANSRITLDTYTQAVAPAKRQAQSKIVSMIVPRIRASEEEVRA